MIKYISYLNLSKKMKSQKNNKIKRAKDLNELFKMYESKDILTNKDFIECVKLIVKFNSNEIIPNYKINEKIKKKFLEKMPFSKNLEFLKEDEDEEDEEEEEYKKQIIDNKTTIEYIKYPSGTTEKITKDTETGKVISKEIDYSEVKQKYIDQLEKLSKNHFLLKSFWINYFYGVIILKN